MSWRSGGVRTWVAQRLSAMYMAGFFAVALVVMQQQDLGSFSAWKAFLQSTPVSVLCLVFIIALLVHAWVGIRDVILDYVHDSALRFVVLSLAGFYLIAMGAWAFRILIING